MVSRIPKQNVWYVWYMVCMYGIVRRCSTVVIVKYVGGMRSVQNM